MEVVKYIGIKNLTFVFTISFTGLCYYFNKNSYQVSLPYQGKYATKKYAVNQARNQRKGGGERSTLPFFQN